MILFKFMSVCNLNINVMSQYATLLVGILYYWKQGLQLSVCISTNHISKQIYS